MSQIHDIEVNILFYSCFPLKNLLVEESIGVGLKRKKTFLIFVSLFVVLVAVTAAVVDVLWGRGEEVWGYSYLSLTNSQLYFPPSALSRSTVLDSENYRAPIRRPVPDTPPQQALSEWVAQFRFE